ncbi:hypothetical protein K8R43_03935 [archaeon]|nr:hypothetical protein [archaeon]
MKNIKYHHSFYKIRNKGFSKILELVLVLVLLFSLVITVSQNIPPTTTSKHNLQVLSRYASDIRNMICNSERDRRIMIKNATMTTINQSINYIAPPDLKHRIVILNTTDDSLIQATGYPNPDEENLMTASCIIVDDETTIEAEVMVWY